MLQRGMRNPVNHWLKESYGSRRGFMLTWWHRFRYLFGDYRVYRQVDWESVERLVFVCKGNICRSAYAEAVARSLGADSISCGIDTIIGGSANEEAIRTAAMKAIDLSEHKTTPFNVLTFKKGDLLIAMEPWQVEYLRQELDNECECTLLGLWGASLSPYIHDPYGSSRVYFHKCFRSIDKSVREIIKKIS